jgi:hypothetical protein
LELTSKKPIEIAYSEANKIDHTVDYIAYYSVNGSTNIGEDDIRCDDVSISVQCPETSPNSEIEEPYFILEISNLHLPWCISDDLDMVFPDKPATVSCIQKIKSFLHLK